MVDVLDRSSIGPISRFNQKSVGSINGYMDVHVGEVKEEGAVLISSDEIHCFGKIAVSEGGLVRVNVYDFVFADERQWWKSKFFVILVVGKHVVAVGKAKIAIESVLGRQEFRLISQVPFADHFC